MGKNQIRSRVVADVFGPVRKTRYKGLYYRKRIDHWIFLDTIYGNETGIGACYATEKELLADIERFAESRGLV